MTGREILYFIKFFSEEQHADQFMAGQLYFNRLSYFKKIEGEDDGRPDTTEAVAMWWQPHDVIMELNVLGIGEVKITKDDLVAPISVAYDHHNHLHLFCLYAVYTTGLKSKNGKFDVTEEEASQIDVQILIDERCLNFGPFAVITPAVPFLAALKTALQQRGQRFLGQLVDYYDDDTFHGEIPLNEIPFKKQKRFSYQREFRICLQTETQGDDPLIVNIGDIQTICAKVASSKLSSLFHLKREPITFEQEGPVAQPSG
jgi:hypothetical protein